MKLLRHFRRILLSGLALLCLAVTAWLVQPVSQPPAPDASNAPATIIIEQPAELLPQQLIVLCHNQTEDRAEQDTKGQCAALGS